jgi:hypothetical protein
MGKIVFVEIDDNNIIVGVHSDAIPSASLPSGYTLVEKEDLEEPSGLVGQNASVIDETIDKRTTLDPLTDKERQRIELRRLSIELDLMVRLGEDTAVIQSEFDALKLIYETP